MKANIGILLELGKVRIASFSTLSVFTGYVLGRGGLGWGVIPVTAGVFLLACGASALNQYQEREIDSRMSRTRGRPIPSGRVSAPGALLISLAMLLAGFACLLPKWPAVVLGALTVLWYNGIYTGLKRLTAFAAVPGGVVGALPPMIGWTYAGGAVTDARILAVAFFFFVWQVPHFWLLLMRIGDDYRSAGMPSLTAVFSRRQLSRVTFVWMLATAVACLLIPLFGVTPTVWLYPAFFIASVWLAWQAVTMLRSNGSTLAFKEINVYALVVISLLSLSGFLN